MMRFKVVVAAYNVPTWIERCLRSIASQDDPGVDVCVVDDGSPAETGQPELIRGFCEERGWAYRLNEQRFGGPLPNQVHAIQTLGGNKEDVIVFIDGDDFLPDPQVLTFLRSVYDDPDVWVAYGTQRNEPESPTTSVARPYPAHAWGNPRSIRGFTWEGGILFNHIRTFRYGLFEHMDPAQWSWPDGSGWYLANGDTVLLVPALELAGPRHTRHMTRITYVYTPDHDQSEWRTRPRDCNPSFLNDHPPYQQLESL